MHVFYLDESGSTRERSDDPDRHPGEWFSQVQDRFLVRDLLLSPWMLDRIHP
jgi:hypothetical protein